jgi:hypothetical protein
MIACSVAPKSGRWLSEGIMRKPKIRDRYPIAFYWIKV